MKTQRKHQRKINSIRNGRWTAYMAAAAASTFAGAGSAEAEIHYSGHVAVKLTGNAHASLPLSNGASLVFENIYGGTFFLQHFHFLMKGAISGSARGYFHSFNRALLSNLPARETVSAGEFFSVAGDPGFGALFTFLSDGEFAPPYSGGGWTPGFVGFRFNIGNGTQYGWARIQTTLDSQGRARDIIKDYAWGDVGDAISTGQTQSLQPAKVNSIPGSLGLLAFGAQGLAAWRMQRPEKSD
jgi:hypothetical protein